MEELWKDIPGFEGYYQASNFGNIRSCDRIVGGLGDHRLKGKNKSFCLSGPKNKKYYYVNLYKNCKGKLYSVHRIIAKLFVPNENFDLVVNHLDGNQLNNHYTNLEWCNMRENTSHNKRKSKYGSGVKKYLGKAKISFSAYINIDGKHKWLGTFDNQYDASNAYKKELLNNKLTNKYA